MGTDAIQARSVLVGKINNYKKLVFLYMKHIWRFFLIMLYLCSIIKKKPYYKSVSDFIINTKICYIMKNVIDFTSTAAMHSYFLTWRAKGRCIFGAYRYRGKRNDYYITNINSHSTDFVLFVIPSGRRFSLSCEKRLVIGTFLCVLQVLRIYESYSAEHVSEYLSNAYSSGDDLPF